MHYIYIYIYAHYLNRTRRDTSERAATYIRSVVRVQTHAISCGCTYSRRKVFCMFFFAYGVYHFVCTSNSVQGRPLKQRDAHKSMTVGNVDLHALYTGRVCCNSERRTQYSRYVLCIICSAFGISYITRMIQIHTHTYAHAI